MSNTSNLWRPTASLDALTARAQLIARIRTFFAERGVLEVDTPLLSSASVTTPFIQSFSSDYVGPLAPQGRQLFLQTSPEFAMKRLLAAGSGDIYQICKAFRNGESGHKHNPEFTMLEWYRVGFDHHALMNEMDELLQYILQCPAAVRITYQDLYKEILNVDPFTDPMSRLHTVAQSLGINANVCLDDRDMWLDLLFSHGIEPTLGQCQPVFVYDFPASQAALARVRAGDPPVAERFEVYYRGVELANGFHELGEGEEQRQRFTAEQAQRVAQGLSFVPVDHLLIDALNAGFPACAGVALGVDRLVMLHLQAASLDEVIAFPVARV